MKFIERFIDIHVKWQKLLLSKEYYFVVFTNLFSTVSYILQNTVLTIGEIYLNPTYLDVCLKNVYVKGVG